MARPATLSRHRDVLLAFDFGLKHIGVAVGQRITRGASPLTTCRARDGKPDWAPIDALVEEWRPRELVVGLPMNMDGSASELGEHATRFANRLAARYRLPVALVDERLSTREANDRASATARHDVAAAVILETFLNEELNDDRNAPIPTPRA